MEGDLTTLSAFLVVAEERSFTRAGKRLGVSPSAMSHAMRALEESLGVRLLSRTTRSVAPTDAGEQLLSRLRPAVSDIQEALDQISGLRNTLPDRPVLVPRLAVASVLVAKAGSVCTRLPGHPPGCHDRRQPHGYSLGRLWCRNSLRRIHRKRHDCRTGISRSSASDRRLSGVF